MVLPDGYLDVTPGRLAAVVTYLEQTARPALPPAAVPEGLRMERVKTVVVEEYRSVFRKVGEPWLWFSRLRMSDEQLRATLAAEGVELFYLLAGSEPLGMLEMDWREQPEVEIVFLGVAPQMVGRGAGGYLMRFAIDEAWRRGPRRLWLHTCTLDHPGALGFYQRFGFVPYRRAVEISEDPRLSGELPREAAPQIPIIEPDSGVR
ncbi:MAG: GNAT family N-acetyltransferase [Acidobacteria bacterium]|nr:GNAT family N-acetyltransferase [Acidobacteriota bacterium]